MADTLKKISTYTFKETITLQKWLADPLCILREENSRSTKSPYLKLLEIEQGGISNLERIVENTSNINDLLEKRNKYLPLNTSNPTIYRDLEVEEGTTVYITLKITNKLNYLLYGNSFTTILPQDTFFLAPALQELIENNLYNISKKVKKSISLTYQYPRVSIWVWSRVLNELKGTENSLINLSPFVESLSLSKGNIEGSASFKLRPIETIFSNQSESWEIDKSYLKDFGNFVGNSITINSLGSYYSTILSENDIFFIALEELEIEGEDIESFDKNFTIPINKIPFQYWDMIGMVDTVVESTSYISGSKGVTVSGRDLHKLFVEDTSYFFPPEQIANGIFATGLDENGIQRYRGHYIGFTSLAYKSIEQGSNFIISAISNALICPNSLFSGYGNLDGEDQRSSITKVKVDEGKPVSFEEEQAQGIWQIIKVQIEDRVSQRKVIDNSIGSQAGNLLEQLQKLAQPPFVELIMDTYKNQFYLTFRQMPFNKDSFKQLADLCEPQFTIDEIISENLSFNKKNIYSWYKINPKGLLGDNSPLLSNFKAVRFPEYGKIWGERSLEITTNYFLPDFEESSDIDISKGLEEGIKDLKILVDTYQANPFLKEGSITILGDRRFKVGTICYLKRTDEYYYIDNVSHSFTSTNGMRTTTLQLSRGMVKEHLGKYFNIIDTPIERITGESRESINNLGSKILGKWKVNKENFDFFIKRLQFVKE